MTFRVESIEGQPLGKALGFIDNPPQWFRRLDRFFLGFFTVIHNAILRGHAKAKLRTLKRWVFDLFTQVENVGLEMANKKTSEGRETVRCEQIQNVTAIKQAAGAINASLSYCTSCEKGSLYKVIDGLKNRVISQCDTHLGIAKKCQVSKRSVIEF